MGWLDDLFGGDSTTTSNDGWTANDGWDYDFKGNQAAYDKFNADLSDNGVLNSDYSNYAGAVPVDPNAKGWTDSFKSPAVLGAAITAGAGLLTGMSALDQHQEELKSAEEARKLQSLLELAKLKNSIMMRGAGGSGGRRGGGVSGPTVQQINQGYSNNKISGLSSLGSNLASIYKS